jgi:hypothetical protein
MKTAISLLAAVMLEIAVPCSGSPTSGLTLPVLKGGQYSTFLGFFMLSVPIIVF